MKDAQGNKLQANDPRAVKWCALGAIQSLPALIGGSLGIVTYISEASIVLCSLSKERLCPFESNAAQCANRR
jgi:hypothetical protein